MHVDLEGRTAMFVSEIMDTLIHTPRLGEEDYLPTIGSFNKVVDDKTTELLEEMRQKGILVVLQTGLGAEGYEFSKSIPHDYLILEYGGIILHDGQPEAEWDKQLARDIKAVRKYKRAAREAKLPIRNEGKRTSFRIAADRERGLSLYAIADRLQVLKGSPEQSTVKSLRVPKVSGELMEFEVVVPAGVNLFVHTYYPADCSQIVVYPESSGILNATKFLANRHNIPWNKIAALGVELPMLQLLEKAAGYSMTFRGSRREIEQLVLTQLDGYVTQPAGIDGTNDALRYVANNLLEKR